MKKLILILIFAILLIGTVSATALASQGIVKQGDTIDLTQICSDATYVTLSSIIYPDRTTIYIGENMTSLGSGVFKYTFDDTNKLGRYDINQISDGCEKTFAYYFEVTESGNSNPEGLVIVVYSILFFVLLAWMLFTLFWNIAMLAELKTDIKDVMYSMLGYFGIIAYYYFAGIYFAKELVLDLNLWMIQIGSFTHVFLPLVGFVLFMTIGRFKQ